MCANFNHTSTDTFSSQVFQSHKVEPDDYFSAAPAPDIENGSSLFIDHQVLNYISRTHTPVSPFRIPLWQLIGL